ncbi:hypothetical protein DIPPA_00192 [Diplonema papillatum]|nr:hypothetical protein DIPPA_00192 [Diplonema papillatum]
MPPAKGRNVRSQRDTAVWGAVALQQHLASGWGLGGERRPRGTPSLAQKIGLVPAREVPEKTTEDQWAAAEVRSEARSDSKDPCAVCHEPFTDRTLQVILSCSHVFHSTCIRNIEKFALSRAAPARACPLCRKTDYEKRPHDAGRCAWRAKMATRVQALWRGVQARRAVLRFKLETNPVFRAQYYFEIVRKVSEDALRTAERREVDLDDLFSKLDRQRTAASLSHITPGQWEHARHQLLERGLSDCSICMASLTYTATPGDAADVDPRETLLLSCSHAFHAPCLMAFEQYDGGTADDPLSKKCPICRSPYATQPFYE